LYGQNIFFLNFAWLITCPGCVWGHLEHSVDAGEETVMTQCVLLNADYSFLNLVNWKRAMCLVAKGKVQVLKQSERFIRDAGGALIKIPAVMRLIKLIRVLYRNRVPFSKRNVLARDGFQCAYCGTRKEKLTVDHIIPKSRGGKTDFENCVASCRPCNNKKGNRTPSEVPMFLKVKAYQPTISEFLTLKARSLGINETLREFGIY
jgi:5-methylcytosine-specific restriction endonuclease McrA